MDDVTLSASKIGRSYIYQGPRGAPANVAILNALVAMLTANGSSTGGPPSVTEEQYGAMFDYYISRPIAPYAIFPQPAVDKPPKGSARTVGSHHASVLLPRAVLNDTTSTAGWATTFIGLLDLCAAEAADSPNCPWSYMYGSLTGNIGSPQETGTALSEGMRTANLHHTTFAVSCNDAYKNKLYNLANYSYFSESAYDTPRWGPRYWGARGYERLQAIKRSVDPGGYFWCHHCVGDAAP